jgi:hypothetical protein
MVVCQNTFSLTPDLMHILNLNISNEWNSGSSEKKRIKEVKYTSLQNLFKVLEEFSSSHHLVYSKVTCNER